MLLSSFTFGSTRPFYRNAERFLTPTASQAANRELSGLEIPNTPASSYKFQGNAFLTIFLFCRLQARAAASHLVSLPCGHRPLEAREAFFSGHRWTFSCGCPQQSQLTIEAAVAGSRTSTRWAHQPSFIHLPPTYQGFYLGSCIFRHIFPQLSFWSTMAMEASLQLLRKSYIITVG